MKTGVPTTTVCTPPSPKTGATAAPAPNPLESVLTFKTVCTAVIVTTDVGKMSSFYKSIKFADPADTNVRSSSGIA